MNDQPSQKTPFLPNDTSLPFFSYGQFKSDQIAYERISHYVDKIESAIMGDCFLAVRDALPLLLRGSTVHPFVCGLLGLDR